MPKPAAGQALPGERKSKIHFKLTHGGFTRRFALFRDDDDLLAALKARVLGLMGTEDISLFWKDEDSLIVLECEDDMIAAIDFAEMQSKLGCVALETGEIRAEKRGGERKAEARNALEEESKAAWNGFAFLCDGCDTFLAPSNGGRFMCAVCPNYDLCAACLVKGDHANHAFIRLLNGETEVPLANGPGGALCILAKQASRCCPKFQVTPSTFKIKKSDNQKKLDELLDAVERDMEKTKKTIEKEKLLNVDDLCKLEEERRRIEKLVGEELKQISKKCLNEKEPYDEEGVTKHFDEMYAKIGNEMSTLKQLEKDMGVKLAYTRPEMFKIKQEMKTSEPIEMNKKDGKLEYSRDDMFKIKEDMLLTCLNSLCHDKNNEDLDFVQDLLKKSEALVGLLELEDDGLLLETPSAEHTTAAATTAPTMQQPPQQPPVLHPVSIEEMQKTLLQPQEARKKNQQQQCVFIDYELMQMQQQPPILQPIFMEDRPLQQQPQPQEAPKRSQYHPMQPPMLQPMCTEDWSQPIFREFSLMQQPPQLQPQPQEAPKRDQSQLPILLPQQQIQCAFMEYQLQQLQKAPKWDRYHVFPGDQPNARPMVFKEQVQPMQQQPPMLRPICTEDWSHPCFREFSILRQPTHLQPQPQQAPKRKEQQPPMLQPTFTEDRPMQNQPQPQEVPKKERAQPLQPPMLQPIWKEDWSQPCFREFSILQQPSQLQPQPQEAPRKEKSQPPMLQPIFTEDRPLEKQPQQAPKKKQSQPLEPPMLQPIREFKEGDRPMQQPRLPPCLQSMFTEDWMHPDEWRQQFMEFTEPQQEPQPQQKNAPKKEKSQLQQQAPKSEQLPQPQPQQQEAQPLQQHQGTQSGQPKQMPQMPLPPVPILPTPQQASQVTTRRDCSLPPRPPPHLPPGFDSIVPLLTSTEVGSTEPAAKVAKKEAKPVEVKNEEKSSCKIHKDDARCDGGFGCRRDNQGRGARDGGKDQEVDFRRTKSERRGVFGDRKHVRHSGFGERREYGADCCPSSTRDFGEHRQHCVNFDCEGDQGRRDECNPRGRESRRWWGEVLEEDLDWFNAEFGEYYTGEELRGREHRHKRQEEPRSAFAEFRGNAVKNRQHQEHRTSGYDRFEEDGYDLREEEKEKKRARRDGYKFLPEIEIEPEEQREEPKQRRFRSYSPPVRGPSVLDFERQKMDRKTAYMIASQMPAHLAIDVLREMQWYSDDCEEVEKRLTEYIKRLGVNKCNLEDHAPMFGDGGDEILIGNIVVDLKKHLCRLRDAARKQPKDYKMIFANTLMQLREALKRNGADSHDIYYEIGYDLRRLLLTSRYTGEEQVCSGEDYVGFMVPDPARDNATPPRVASAHPEKEGIFAPRPSGCNMNPRDHFKLPDAFP